MNLFQSGIFTLAAGGTASFKIECDALTDDDWDTLAELVAGRFKFRKVVSVPRGGDKLASRLFKRASSDGVVLVIDDVYTTGKSIRKIRDREGADAGVVVFARNPIAPSDANWVYPIFQMWAPRAAAED